MQGNMMLQQFNVIQLLTHAAQFHPTQEVVTQRVEGDIHRSNYKTIYTRASQLANALATLGVQQGDCIASLAWNTYRHMEIYYAVSGMGAVIHTVNPRLFDDQIAYIINHAEDKWVFVDTTFIPQLERLQDELKTVKGFIVLCDEDAVPNTKLKNCICYESIISEQSTAFTWPQIDENSAASLCYTSGTTGAPKGVLYSHRAAVLHAMAMVNESVLDIRQDSVILPMVTMYHASAWGIPYAAPIVGAKLVLPGRGMDGETMHRLITTENVNLGMGVPTLWLTLLNYLTENDLSIPSLKRVCVGGSASPHHLVRTFDQDYDVYWQPLWGMTETGPLATSAPQTSAMKQLTQEQRYEIQTSAGKPVFGAELEIVDDEGHPVPHDGVSRGELRIRGPWIVGRYFKRDSAQGFVDGWLDTGDIATIDEQGYLRIVDRKKDVIKSGGEWISSLELEDIISDYPHINEVCVIGVKHEKWDERPLVLATLKPGVKVDKREIYDFLVGKIAKWWTPDDIVFVEELPHTGTGKLIKHSLRDQYQNYLLEQGS